jgi:hypothetical protein
MEAMNFSGLYVWKVYSSLDPHSAKITSRAILSVEFVISGFTFPNPFTGRLQTRQLAVWFLICIPEGPGSNLCRVIPYPYKFLILSVTSSRRILKYAQAAIAVSTSDFTAQAVHFDCISIYVLCFFYKQFYPPSNNTFYYVTNITCVSIKCVVSLIWTSAKTWLAYITDT